MLPMVEPLKLIRSPSSSRDQPRCLRIARSSSANSARSGSLLGAVMTRHLTCGEGAVTDSELPDTHAVGLLRSVSPPPHDCHACPGMPDTTRGAPGGRHTGPREA